MSESINQPELVDVLRDVLETLHFKGSIFFRSALASPWGMSLDRQKGPRFHIALTGECYVGSQSHDPVLLIPNDILILPNGDPHWISDQPGRELVSSVEAANACELDNPLFQDGAITNKLICGLIQFEQRLVHSIFDALPDVIHLSGLTENERIWSLINLIDSELEDATNKQVGVIDRLTEVLFIKLLNHYVESGEAGTGFLAALGDRRVYRALSLIHSNPEFDWTLDTLGTRSGMSRATLIRKFQDIVGVSPMAYLSDWRIMKAYDLVKHTATSLDRVAESTGFASSRTLSKAFKRHYGFTPTELRHSNRRGH